ncbi:Gfo/Idh/MocA family oxidoreductase [Jiangella muralis]|uniref:Gfo/Idh/MocA family oxidoreductase n=1 Tax=Jiangella muralis TaxID=702383 RepID=UPI00069F908F|nr:Gfo/Idh/MocA family oxidoreductase [Jiangella muralis]
MYDDDIDVEDIYSALISFAGEAHLSYLINFSSTWEGFRCVIAGTHGEIETAEGASITGGTLPGSGEVHVRPLFGPARTVTPPIAAGGHGGADPLLRADLFLGPSRESTELGLLATSRDGATAVAAGEAIGRSVREHRPMPIALFSNGTRGRSTLSHHPLSTSPNKEESCPTTTETNRPTTVGTPSPGGS